MAGISTSIKIAGADTFENSLKKCGQSIKLAGAEAKKVETQLKNDNSLEAGEKKIKAYENAQAELKKKIELLKTQIESQKQAVQNNASETEKAKAKYEQLAKTLGAEAEETQKAYKEWEQADKMLAKSEKDLNSMQTNLVKAETEEAKFSNKAHDVKTALDQVGDEAKKTGNEIEGSASKLSKFSSVGKVVKAGALAMGTAIAGATVGIAKAIKSTSEFADNIDKASQKLGISAEAYQKWGQVLEHSGTSIDNMKASFKKLATTSQSDSASVVEAYGKIGLSMEEVRSLSTEDLFGKVVQGLQGMEEGTERTALATTLLGKGAQEMGALLNTSAEDTQKMLDKVDKLGGVLSNDAVKAGAQFQDSLQDLKLGFTGVKNTLSAMFLPSLSKVMDGMSDLFTGSKEGMKTVNDGIKEFANTIQNALPKIQEKLAMIGEIIVGVLEQAVPLVLQTVGDLVLSVGSALISKLPEMVNSIVTTLVSLFPKFTQVLAQLVSTLAQGIGTMLPKLIPTVIDAVGTCVSALVDNADKMIDGAIALVEGLINGLMNAIPKLVEKIPVIIQKVVSSVVANAPKLIVGGIKLIGQLAIGLIKAIPELVKSIPKIIGAIVSGLGDGLRKIAEVGKNIIKGLWQGILNAKDWLLNKIKSFAHTITQGIKDFFGIKSPSRVMRDQVGKYLGQGVGVGLDKSKAGVLKTVDHFGQSITKEMQDKVNGRFASAMNLNGQATANLGTIERTALTTINSEFDYDRLAGLMSQGIYLDGRELGRTMRKAGVIV